MRRSTWLHGLRASLGHSKNRCARSVNRGPIAVRRPRFEHLEDRRLLATTLGMQGDGETSLLYDARTGEFILQPDGTRIEFFDIVSSANIFNANAVYPPGGMPLANVPWRKTWTAVPFSNAFSANFSLGVIAAPHLPRDFVLNDLTITVNGGSLDRFTADLTYLHAGLDQGDAPDASAGIGHNNYNTRWADNGPSHAIVAGLHLGALVDGNDGTLWSPAANADDVDTALPDDEDGVSNPAADLVLTVGANQGTNGFTYFDVPGQSQTAANGINDLGQVVGVAYPAGLGFVRDGANITTHDSPGPNTTTFTGINNTGLIVGYNTIGAAGRGFVKNGPDYTPFAVPGFDSTIAYGINDAGQIVGYYENVANPNDRGFLWDGNTYTFIDMPLPGTISTTARGINNHGVVVGSFQDAGATPHGFVKNGNSYVQLDVPGAQSTSATGINDAGQVVGYYFANSQDAYGFVKDGATYTTIHVPGADDTIARGINNAGQIVGSYAVQNRSGGFVYTPPTPGPTVSVRVTNTTGAAATLYGWIDYNANGVFDNATERAIVAVPNGTNNADRDARLSRRASRLHGHHLRALPLEHRRGGGESDWRCGGRRSRRLPRDDHPARRRHRRQRQEPEDRQRHRRRPGACQWRHVRQRRGGARRPGRRRRRGPGRGRASRFGSGSARRRARSVHERQRHGESEPTNRERHRWWARARGRRLLRSLGGVDRRPRRRRRHRPGRGCR